MSWQTGSFVQGNQNFGYQPMGLKQKIGMALNRSFQKT